MSALFTAEFWAMGGHGAYVWSAYGICALVLAALAVASVVTTRRRERDLAAREAGRGRRQGTG